MHLENYEPIEYKLSKSQVEKQKREISEQFDILSQREDNWDGRGSQKPTVLTLMLMRKRL